MSTRPKHILSRTGDKGVALLTVLVAMMIISLILFEFQYNSMVERKLAYNDLNQTQAYYLAKSGARLGVLRVVLYARLMQSPQIKSMAGQADVAPLLQKVWSIPQPPFPPSAASLAKMDKTDKDASETALSQTKIKDGTYTYSIRSEGSKINLNSLLIPKDVKEPRIDFTQPPKHVFEYSAQLLYNLVDGFLKESERPYDEYPDLRPDELVLDIIDWVNPGNNRLAGGTKDTFYESQTPPYKAKRNRFFTVDELRLVRGVTEKVFSKLKPHVTVYSFDGRININEASDTILRTLYTDFTDKDLELIKDEKAKYDGSWPSEKTFVDFITQTLGRSSFTTLFPDPSNYPFTVKSESFLVESIGRLEKSKSSVQRVIRVAVALSDANSSGGQVVSGIADQKQCQATPTAFWDKRDGQCRNRPTDANQCQFIGATWMPDSSGRFGCKINNEPLIYPAGTKTNDKSKQTPSAVRILSWSEV